MQEIVIIFVCLFLLVSGHFKSDRTVPGAKEISIINVRNLAERHENTVIVVWQQILIKSECAILNFMVEKHFVQQDIKQDQILTGTKLDFPVISQFLSSADYLWSSRIFVALLGLWLRWSDQRTADMQTSSRYSHRNDPE